MVALDAPVSAASGRRFALPAWSSGIGAGFITGVGLIMDFEILVLTSLVTLACIIKRVGHRAMPAWGAAYVLTSGLWLFPAAHGPVELVSMIVGLPLAGALFYGTIYIVSLQVPRLPWELAFGISVCQAEWLAAQAGLSVAPVGLASIGSGAEWLVAGVGVYGASGIIATVAAILARVGVAGLGLAIPVAFGAMIIPTVPSPLDGGPEYAAIRTNPDAIEKWTSITAAAELEAMIDLSRRKSGTLTIWPENAVRTTLRIDTAVAAIPEDIRPVLFGMTHVDPETNGYRNSAVLVGTDGSVQMTTKTALVPITEGGVFVPSREALETGARSRLILGDGRQVLALLCYEAAFRIPKADLEDVDTIFILAAESGFWQPVGSAIMNRHARVRELETGINVEKISDYGGMDQ